MNCKLYLKYENLKRKYDRKEALLEKAIDIIVKADKENGTNKYGREFIRALNEMEVI